MTPNDQLHNLSRILTTARHESFGLSLTDGRCLHIQTSDEGLDFSLIDVNNKKVIDGGRIFNNPAVTLDEKTLIVCGILGIACKNISSLIPTDELDDLLDEMQ